MRDWGLGASGNSNSAIGTLTILQGRSLGYARDDDGVKRYQNSAALHYFLRRTTISHFSFLISHSSEAFTQNQRAARPAANPEPDFLKFSP